MCGVYELAVFPWSCPQKTRLLLAKAQDLLQDLLLAKAQDLLQYHLRVHFKCFWTLDFCITDNSLLNQ